MAPALAERARTVRYDRRRAAPAGDLPARTAADLARDLEALLKALGISPPYVLVAHSWGGVIARTFAHAHPARRGGPGARRRHARDDRFARLRAPAADVFADERRRPLRRRPPVADEDALPAGRAAGVSRAARQRASPIRCCWRESIRTARSEGAGIRPSLAALARDCPDLPAIPVHVLTAGGVTGPNVKQIQRVHEAWKAMVARAARARYTNIPSSGHQMPVEVPDGCVDPTPCSARSPLERRSRARGSFITISGPSPRPPTLLFCPGGDGPMRHVGKGLRGGRMSSGPGGRGRGRRAVGAIDPRTALRRRRRS